VTFTRERTNAAVTPTPAAGGGPEEQPLFNYGGGAWRCSGAANGYLRTTQTFSDFVFSCEFRWGRQVLRPGKALDSGIFVRAVGPDGNSEDGAGAFLACVEVNLFQGACGDILLLRGRDAAGGLIAPEMEAETGPRQDRDGWLTWQPGGAKRTIKTWGRLNWSAKSPEWADREDFRGPEEIENPRGQWNFLSVECHGDILRVRLNDTLVNEARLLLPREGWIALQAEGAEIEFRNVHIQPVAPGR
jgi:hypothetical protein